jgi:hypothetical protein
MPTMPFGKHKDLDMMEVRTSYLVWCLFEMENLYPATRRMIEQELAARARGWGWLAPCWAAEFRRGFEAGRLAGNDAEPRVPEEVAACFRRLCLRYHPDRGGSTETQTALNELYEAVRQSAGK